MSDLTAALKPELWTVSSNEAVKLYVTEPNGTAVAFKPTFTYPIFGDSESIFGFQNLVIFLCFDHYTFYPFLNVKYDKKLRDDIEDPRDTMMKVLPASTVFKDEAKWVDAIKKEKEAYTIPGDKIASSGQYDIYRLDLKSEAGEELHKRLQILVLLYIEAGSYIDSKDDLWDVYAMYDTSGDEPSIVGFCTAYNYWKYPGAAQFDEGVVQIRKKISQFVILSNYQGQRLGSKFYTALYETWLQDKNIVEVVVEDPNESFDDLRDKSDLLRLKNIVNIKSVDFTKIKSDWLQQFKTQQKLEKRQLNRLIEMILLYNLKHFNAEDKKAIRLFIKKRLYDKNKEVLTGLEKPVRLDKLQTAYQALEEDYYRILDGLKLNLDKRVADAEPSGASKRTKV